MNSFRYRLLVLIIGLIAVTQTVTLLAVLTTTRGNVEARAAQQLTAGGSYALQLVRFRASQLASGVAVLAADFGFREAVSSLDAPTILSAAANQSRRIDADLLLLVNTDGALITSTERIDPDFAASTTELVDRALMSPETPHFALLSGRLYQFFAAPVKAPDTIAWVIMGFAVTDATARRIGDLVDVDVSFVVAADGGRRNAASTLPADRRGLLPPVPVVVDRSRPFRADHGDEAYLVHVVSLDAADDTVQLVLQKPVADVLAPYVSVRNTLLIVGGTALVLAVVIAILLGQGATRPIAQLVTAARRIEDGDYEDPIAVEGSDEFHRLSGTLNAMRQRVAEREARIRHQAYHDVLTGLPNRTQAEADLARMLEEAGVACVTAILLHLVNLRELNASVGHSVGDEVLRTTATRLGRFCRPGEFVATLGASRFLVLLNRPHSAADVMRLATGVVDTVREPMKIGDIDVELQARAGICTSPEQATAPDEMIRRAEIALHDRESAHEPIGHYRSGSDEEHLRRLALMSDLRRAIEGNTLALAFQPKIAIGTKRVTSVEALLRWQHPRLGAVSPAEFVPLAEQTGGSRQLTDWVLRAAIRQQAEWQRSGLALDIAVNLSAGDIVDPGLGDAIFRLLAEHRVAATRLVLEITESAMMQDPLTAARNMEILRVAGVRFAIDDFGTGYSSLSQLRKLPVDELKIDRSFVSRAHLSADDRSIVTSTVELGHNLGLRVVAEGVEEAETLLLLRGIGCDYAQGYLISRPLPGDAIAAFVRDANQALEDADSTLIQVRALEKLSGRG